MSATNRGTERKRHDAYETPPWAVWRLLDAIDLPGGNWLEPCAGTGEIIRAVNNRRDDVRWTAIEIRECCQQKLEASGIERVEMGDFFELPQWRNGVSPVCHIEVVLTNPPFSLAERFVRQSMMLAPVVAMLLRLNWLAGPRAEWLRESMPDVFVLPNRPSFTGGGTDATEYCWAVFERDACHGRSRGLVQVLADTSQQERKVRL